MMRNGVVLTMAALALGACTKPAGGGAAASAPEAAKPAAALAQAPAAMPTRKAGLWKQTVSTAGMQQATSLCLDPSVESKISVMGTQMAKSACGSPTITPVPGGWSFSSTCDMGSGGKTTSTGTVTGDFNSAYKVEAESTTEGAAAPQMNGPHKMTVEAVWQGPCPAGMKPGDMVLPNGMKFNMVEMSAGGGPAAAAAAAAMRHQPGK